MFVWKLVGDKCSFLVLVTVFFFQKIYRKPVIEHIAYNQLINIIVLQTYSAWVLLKYIVTYLIDVITWDA